MNKDNRYEILRRFQLNNPNPTIELLYRSPFELLISVLLSSQSTDYQVNKVTKNLFEVANTPENMLLLGIDGIKTYIRSVGLFNNKAKNIFKTCQLLLNEYDGVIPEDRALLERFPGIGRKSANVLLNIIFMWPVIAVDTHVFRFCNRSRFAVGKDVKTVEMILYDVVPNVFQFNCHRWFVLHGRYICRSKNPVCHICFISDICEFCQK